MTHAPRTAVALRHLAFEDLGVLGPLLEARGVAVTYVDVGVDPLEVEQILGADVVVVLGGPIGVGDTADFPYLAQEIAAIAQRLARDLPTLGICLGAQVMAAALGAAVVPGEVGPEIGFAPLALTPAGEASALAPLTGGSVLHWHGDTFAIPDGATRLASTSAYPHQAFSIGRSLAVQFHVEADPARIEQWLIGHSHELRAVGADLAALRADAARLGPDLAARAAAVLDAWLS